jgi:GTP cyclohydrolase I
LLVFIGENPDRPGLEDTPRRFANYWREFINYEPGTIDTAFEVVTTDQMITVSGIRVWSLCEHHLLPFWCDVAIGYIATDKVLGLSKFARIAHKHAHRLQVQERLVDDIANEITALTGSDDVAVVSKGVHTCMVMRGFKTDGVMTSSVMRGIFRERPEARAEFMGLTK